MNIGIKNLLGSFVILFFILSTISCSENNNEDVSDIIKVALRDVGHQLLLSNKDSVSLVLPITELEELKYQVSFEQQLSIHPDTLVTLIKSSIQKAGLPQNYLTEVVDCSNREVVYSYEMKGPVEKGIIPCRGRNLPKDCYTVQLRFTGVKKSSSGNLNVIYALLLGFFLTAVFIFLKIKKRILGDDIKNYTSIGSFKFYPEQNKLVKSAQEINLSRKECELLAIFIANPNMVIKRDELTKRVWEDNGVIVGRSLDTYISKLRKKLQEDESIKLINIHGVGYKLEIG